MTTILSSPTTVTVNPPPTPGTPALGPLAASMAPGTWAQLTVSNQNAVLGVGPSSGTMLPYCNEMPWNPIQQHDRDHRGGSWLSSIAACQIRRVH